MPFNLEKLIPTRGAKPPEVQSEVPKKSAEKTKGVEETLNPEKLKEQNLDKLSMQQVRERGELSNTEDNLKNIRERLGKFSSSASPEILKTLGQRIYELEEQQKSSEEKTKLLENTAALLRNGAKISVIE